MIPRPRQDKGQVRKVTPEELLEAINAARPHFRDPRTNKRALYRFCIERWLRLRNGQSARSPGRRELRRQCSLRREGGVKRMKRKRSARRNGLYIKEVGRALSFHRAVKRIASAVRDGAPPNRRDQPGGSLDWYVFVGVDGRVVGRCQGGCDTVPVVATLPAHRARPSNSKTYGSRASRQGSVGECVATLLSVATPGCQNGWQRSALTARSEWNAIETQMEFISRGGV
jgi:hypothetical protein